MLRCAICLRKACKFQEFAEGLLLICVCESSKAFNSLSKIYFGLSLHIFQLVRHCLWKMCATPGACVNKTGLFSLAAAVVPQSKSTKLCSSSAAAVPQSKSIELCSSLAAVVPQSKSTKLCSSSAAAVPQSKSTEM